MSHNGFDDSSDDVLQSIDEHQDSGRGVRVRLWIAGILAVLIVGIFVAERYVILVQPNITRMQERRDLQSAESLEEDALRVLDGFGILPEWIRKRSIEFEHTGHVRWLWLIKTPHDVSIASVNLELKNLVEGLNGRVFAIENARDSHTTIHLSFRGTIRYSLLFMPTREVRRQAGRIVLLVDGIESAPESEIKRYIQSREQIACIIEPRKESIPIHARLRQAGRQSVLHIHLRPARVLDSRFELAEDMRDEELTIHVRYIVRNFPDCNYYYVTSERAPGVFARMVDERMRAQGLNKIESSLLNYIDRGTQRNVMSARMNDIAMLSVREGTAVGVIELRDGVMSFLDEEIARLRKKGFSFHSAEASKLIVSGY